MRFRNESAPTTNFLHQNRYYVVSIFGISPRDNSHIACVFVRVSFHSALRMRTKAATKARCDDNRGDRTVHETASRSSRDRNVTRCMCRAMRVESDDGLNKQSRTRVSREIHSFVWYPPDLPRPPLAFISLALYLPPFSRLFTVHLIFMSPYI